MTVEALQKVMPAGEFDRRYFCFLKNGMESWIPAAVELAGKLKGDKKPKDVIQMFVGIWLRSHQSEDEDLWDQAMSFAATMPNVKIRRLPPDDPYWKEVGIAAESDES